MRRELAKKEDIRDVFSGTFVRFGTKNGYKGPEPTVLLKEIHDISGKVVTSHLWFNLTKGFANLGPLVEGDVIEFRARVTQYIKGYQGRRDDVYVPIEADYKLSRPTKLRVVGGTRDQ
jgi:hypothetical protein